MLSYTPNYTPDIARILAEEFGEECRVWVFAEIALGRRRGAEADIAWTLVAEQLARKAAHFGLQALRDSKGHLTV